MTRYARCTKCGNGQLGALVHDEIAFYTCGCVRRIEDMQIPDCSGIPESCELCNIMRMIFEGFPAEENPDCEKAVARRAGEKIGRMDDKRSD